MNAGLNGVLDSKTFGTAVRNQRAVTGLGRAMGGVFFARPWLLLTGRVLARADGDDHLAACGP
jgi:hypothetical protein